IQDYLKSWMLSQTPVTLAYDAAATNRARRAAREAVQPVTDEYNKNDVLVPAGVVLDEDRLALLRAEYEAMQREVDPNQRTARIATVFLMVLVLAVLNGFYIVYYEPKLARSAGRLGLYLAVLVIAVALGRVASLEYRAEIIPLMVTAMILAIAYNQVLATITAFTLTLLITFSTVADLGQFIILMSVSATSIIPLKSVPSRATIVKIGFLAAAVFFLVSVGTGILGSQAISQVWTSTDLLKSSLRGAAYCLVAGYFVAGTLPFIESGFGVVTDISLLEMSDVSHPLLQELVRRAPGTYNHSMTVATIAETAADKIGANGLLVRVGAYYHDVGKMLKPQYFIENVSEGTESGHAHLNPAMSTLVIIGHVKDGVDLARQHNLPQPLIDFIEQHHGTTLVEYFYREAARLAVEQPDHKTDAEESNFRYPGPKPQTREAGVLMLADCVESASRTLSEPTPKRLENLVKSLAMKRLLDGQFDESSLTLSEIRIVEESLIKSLIGIYHGRIKYTVEQRTA
ncbi:MAG: HD family phosphohydrolase, partial [Planctomycetaceae bacterium]